ncbi:hypothetical protein EDB84DRAFT_598519 [Lactarius hengduanensis]|nr:hypothetical protein EDB84DRAFT_598519 [Lactarius hengduanensis]
MRCIIHKTPPVVAAMLATNSCDSTVDDRSSGLQRSPYRSTWSYPLGRILFLVPFGLRFNIESSSRAGTYQATFPCARFTAISESGHFGQRLEICGNGQRASGSDAQASRFRFLSWTCILELESGSLHECRQVFHYKNCIPSVSWHGEVWQTMTDTLLWLLAKTKYTMKRLKGWVWRSLLPTMFARASYHRLSLSKSLHCDVESKVAEEGQTPGSG